MLQDLATGIQINSDMYQVVLNNYFTKYNAFVYSFQNFEEGKGNGDVASFCITFSNIIYLQDFFL